MKGLVTAVGFMLLLACQLFANEQSTLARITVYWHGNGSGEHAAWNGTRLREEHCAVDPKRIPYGSKVVFPDAECVAVDSGPDVINAKPRARVDGRRPSVMPLSLIGFSAANRKRLSGHKRIRTS